MESAKEKAKELIKKFTEPTKVPNIKKVWVEDLDAAKQCALICVEEIMKDHNDVGTPDGNKRYWQ